MRSEPLLILISGAPLNHAGRNSIVIWGVNRQGCRFSRPAPWMARGGGPPNHCRIAGTPSLGEVPSGGARALCLLWGFSKVSRRKGGTLSRHHHSNGYVHRKSRTARCFEHHAGLTGRHWGLPRVGVRSAPNPAERGVPDTAHRLVWGCCAAQRRTSLLATGICA